MAKTLHLWFFMQWFYNKSSTTYFLALNYSFFKEILTQRSVNSMTYNFNDNENPEKWDVCLLIQKCHDKDLGTSLKISLTFDKLTNHKNKTLFIYINIAFQIFINTEV